MADLFFSLLVYGKFMDFYNNRHGNFTITMKKNLFS